MKEYKNKLVIIGNGFDLAHGLKTSYNDFITWYLEQTLSTIGNHNFYYEDKIISYKFKYKGYQMNDLVEHSKLSLVDWFLNDNGQNIEMLRLSSFFQRLLANKKTYSWVDIETEFYKNLILVYNQCLNTENYAWKLGEINTLNEDIEFLKNKLEEYLKTINCKKNNQDINRLFQSDFCVGYHMEDEDNKLVHYLNFNYTNTIENYINQYSNFQLNYIHGKLNDKTNPLIFGYGDEMDEHYKKIEDLNINNFLNNFKSFGYFKTEKYSNLLRFINAEPYDIEILGHSCGLSDRVLLNTIFEHDNCESIKIHYYQKSETENDFLIKTQEISRHFNDKAKMRDRIVDFTKCKPLVRYSP